MPLPERSKPPADPFRMGFYRWCQCLVPGFVPVNKSAAREPCEACGMVPSSATARASLALRARSDKRESLDRLTLAREVLMRRREVIASIGLVIAGSPSVLAQRGSKQLRIALVHSGIRAADLTESAGPFWVRRFLQELRSHSVVLVLADVHLAFDNEGAEVGALTSTSRMSSPERERRTLLKQLRLK